MLTRSLKNAMVADIKSELRCFMEDMELLLKQFTVVRKNDEIWLRPGRDAKLYPGETFVSNILVKNENYWYYVK